MKLTKRSIAVKRHEMYAQPGQTITIRYRGDWYVVGPEADIQPKATVTVTGKGGKTWQVRIVRVDSEGCGLRMAVSERVREAVTKPRPIHVPGYGWGVLCPLDQAVVGTTITVHARNGKTWEAIITESAGQTSDDAAIVWTKRAPKREKTPAKRTRTRYTGSSDYRMLPGGIPGPMRGCGACRQLGRMCQQCEFDEFDC